MFDIINTLEFGVVEVKKDKTYTMNYIDIVELCNGDFYELYTNWQGKVIAIKIEDNE